MVIESSKNPIITKDGVTVAKHIEVGKRSRNIGCRLLKRVAGNTNEIAGDGTTTSTILTNELVK